MSLMRCGAVACLLLVFANAGSNAADEAPAQDLILGKWSMEPERRVESLTTSGPLGLIQRKIAKDKVVTHFMELEYRNDGKAKMTFWLGAPETKQGAREATYRLIDKSTLELNWAPPGSKQSELEQYEIVLLTEDRLTVRAKGNDRLLRFHRIK
jgi:hypothetical protein